MRKLIYRDIRELPLGGTLATWRLGPFARATMQTALGYSTSWAVTVGNGLSLSVAITRSAVVPPSHYGPSAEKPPS